MLCDGNNGTPDLRNNFVVGAGDTYNPGNSGGSINHLHAFDDGSHYHDDSDSSHTHNMGGVGDVQLGPDVSDVTDSTTTPFRSDNANIAGNTDNGNGLPPYKSVVYIMQT